jgi:hypothetical protein
MHLDRRWPATVVVEVDNHRGWSVLRRSQFRRWNQRLTGRFPTMDRETILRDLAQIEDRVARTQRQTASYREHIARLEDSGRSAEWAKLMLRQCEEVMALHLSMHARLIERLSRSTK